MDSFFLAEMFKYLFLLFADAEDLPFDVEDYVFTTEAHLLPLSLSTAPHSSSISSNRTVIVVIPLSWRCDNVMKEFLQYTVIYSMILQSEEELDDSNFDWTCPNTRLLFPDPAFPRNLREPIRNAVDKSCPRPAPYRYVYNQVWADHMAAVIVTAVYLPCFNFSLILFLSLLSGSLVWAVLLSGLKTSLQTTLNIWSCWGGWESVSST